MEESIPDTIVKEPEQIDSCVQNDEKSPEVIEKPVDKLFGEESKDEKVLNKTIEGEKLTEEQEKQEAKDFESGLDTLTA